MLSITNVARNCKLRQPATQRTKRVAAIVRAENNRQSGSNVDWDGAWKRFKRQMQSQVDANDVGNSFINRGKTSADEIKREEQLFINLWVNQNTQIYGGVLFFVVATLILVSAGPPPTDARCTLPWC